ncbi:unnamed protein product [Lathyrus sativus]|nr:unnamed protein product [Lathyrus sativus]
MGVFTVIFHHEGNILHDKFTFYRGDDTVVEGQNSDTWSFFEAASLIKDWGYDGFRLWTKFPGIDEGLLHVIDDVLA